VGRLLVDQLRTMARLYPDQVAYNDLDGRRALTFAAWNQESNQLARGLAAHGIAHGDRVAIDLPSARILDWIVTYAAIHKAGAVAVPVNTRLTTRELQTILGHAEISGMITCYDLAVSQRLHEVWPELPTLRWIATVDDAPFDMMPIDLLTDNDDDDFQVAVEPGDLADIMYTSGTTGTPKGVAVRHRNVALLPNGEVPWTDTYWLHGSPPFTFAGISFVYNPMKLGMGALFQAHFDADRWLAYVEEYRPTSCFFVPAMAQLLIHADRWETADLDSLTLVSLGSAPLPPDTLLKLCDRFPRALVTNGYGMTEAGPAYCLMSKEEVRKRIGSVGQPMPPMEVRIVDPVTAEDQPTGETGEVLIRAKGREREYYKDPAATAAAWTPDGWLHSGDLGRLDADGFLYIVGRMKEVIIRGGNNVYATDVEAVLYEHPDVLEAAVVGVPHEVLGEDIAAYVVARPGTTLDLDELDRFCRDRLAGYKCPRHYHVLDTLPRNATGKVRKHDLPA
jgi:acyl-CoA synthetase (AMP-forming)/AMP-acid ligase II